MKPQDDYVIETQALSKRYGSKLALDFPPDEVQARLHREFLALAPRKSA